jgi:hypothetical protein
MVSWELCSCWGQVPEPNKAEPAEGHHMHHKAARWHTPARKKNTHRGKCHKAIDG